MLTELKKAIAMETANDDVNTDLADDSIKAEYLDDPEGAIIGAENDPEIKKFIEMIPESDDLDPVSEKEVNEIINNVAEATLLEDDVEDVRATDDESDTDEEPGEEIENDLDEDLEEGFDDFDFVTEASDDDFDDEDFDDLIDEFIEESSDDVE